MDGVEEVHSVASRVGWGEVASVREGVKRRPNICMMRQWEANQGLGWDGTPGPWT